MNAPQRRGRGRPPENAVILLSVATAREDSEAEFDALTDLFRGYERLIALRTRRELRRQYYVPAGSPVITPEMGKAA